MLKYAEKIKNTDILKLLTPFVKDKKAYIVGGFIRDIMINPEITPVDTDLILCDVDAEAFARNFADNVNGHFIELDSENKIYRIVLEDKIRYVDVASALDNDLEHDIKRRDLTINAVAYDINSDKFIDLTGGIEDIKNKVIRGISEQNFVDDSLRLLRIFRFYSKTGFEIEKETFGYAKKYSKNILKPAKERINTELLKLFEGKYCDKALLKLDESGLLEEIFPVVKEIKTVPPNTHHHLPLFYHSIETVKQIGEYYEKSTGEVKSELDEEKFGCVKNIGLLRLAGFLHDAGKPDCRTIDKETGRERFIGHDNIGAEKIFPVLKGLKFSKKQAEFVCNLIKYHIYPSSMISSEGISEKTYMKFYRKTEGFVIEVIILAMADRLSARGPAITEETVKNNINGLTDLLETYLEKRKEIKPLPKLLDGFEIMEILNINRSPLLGEVVNALKEAQISSEVITKEDAISFVTEKFGIKT